MNCARAEVGRFYVMVAAHSDKGLPLLSFLSPHTDLEDDLFVATPRSPVAHDA